MSIQSRAHALVADVYLSALEEAAEQAAGAPTAVPAIANQAMADNVIQFPRKS